MLRFIEHDNGRDTAFVDHVYHRVLDVGPQLSAPMRRSHADFAHNCTVQVER